MLKKTFAISGVIAALAIAPAMAASSSASSKANFGQAISAIQSSKNSASQIQGMTEVKSVNVVKVGDLAQGQNMTAFDNAVTKNDADITSLRTAIDSNTAVKTALTSAGVEASAVVAAEMSPDGGLTVYTR